MAGLSEQNTGGFGGQTIPAVSGLADNSLYSVIAQNMVKALSQVGSLKEFTQDTLADRLQRMDRGREIKEVDVTAYFPDFVCFTFTLKNGSELYLRHSKDETWITAYSADKEVMLDTSNTNRTQNVLECVLETLGNNYFRA